MPDLSVGQWIIVGLAGLFALVGFGLMAINVAAIIRPRHAGEKGPPRKLVGKPSQLTRRAFFRRALGTAFGFLMLDFGAASIAFLWPSLGGGFGGVISPPDTIEAIKQRISDEGKPYYYGPGRFYLVTYNGDDKDGLYTKPIATAGGQALVAEGLMALYQRCVHLGCRVPFCDTSQWFECPCHGSKYNAVGEYKDGPAPRGLDRFPLVAEQGVLRVNTGIVITGPARGIDTTNQQPEGAFCVTVGGAAEEEH